MAMELMDEHEQSEAVRAWLRNNAGAILLGLVVGAVLVAGYWWFKNAREQHATKAQAEFAQLEDALTQKDAAKVAEITARIDKEFGDTNFATLALLRQAQEEVNKGDSKSALVTLQKARDHASVPALRDLTSLRVAQIQLALGDAQSALDALTKIEVDSYKARVADLRGDAYVAMAKNADARKAYEEALANLDATSPDRSFIEMKRDDLPAADAPAPVAAPAPAATTAAAEPAKAGA